MGTISAEKRPENSFPTLENKYVNQNTKKKQ